MFQWMVQVLIFQGQEMPNIYNWLNFRLHVRYICSKLSKTIVIFYKLRYIVPDFIMLDLYSNQLIRISHIVTWFWVKLHKCI